jgi:hypothetical protein
MKNLKVLSKKKWALSHGFILAGLILLSIGLALGPGRYVRGIIGLIIAGIWCFAGGLCFIFIPAFRKLAQK